jgi:ELWxxDGT repeat protein
MGLCYRRRLIALVLGCFILQCSVAAATASPVTDGKRVLGQPYLFLEIVPGSGSASPRNLVVLDGVLFFVADYGDSEKLWRSDGSAEGSYVLKTVTVPTIGNPLIEQLTVAGNQVFFSTCDSGTKLGPYKLWKTDGAAAGTILVRDLARGGTFYSPLQNLTAVNSALFFTGRDEFTYYKPWWSDGTTAGTMKLGAIRILVIPYEGPFSVVGSRLYFPVDAGGMGNGPIRLWTTDGTPAHAAVVREDLSLDPYSSFADHTAAVGDVLYFNAKDAAGNWGLWQTNGTAGGTSLVRSGYVKYLTNIAGTLYFQATDDVHGTELWKSDGSPAGTVMVSDIRASGSSYPLRFTNAGGTVYFTADDGTHGIELWRTDGTAAGTRLVRDIYPGDKSAAIYSMVGAGGYLYFTATDGIHGIELWITDGTEQGTRMMADIRNGAGNGVSWVGIEYDGRLVFPANDGVNGTELWAVDLPVTRYFYLPVLLR